MSDYVLTCCSTVDLSKEHLDGLGVPYANFHYEIDGEQFDDDLFQTMSADEFYERLVASKEASTSQVNIAQYEELFTPILEAGKDVLHVCISSGISGTYNSAVNAARVMSERYPERKVYVVDSLAASSGYGLLIDTMAGLRDQGMGIDQLRDWAEEHKLNLHHWFFSTDLSFYIRGGRVSKSAGTIAGILNICAFLNMDEEGHLAPQKNIRGKKKVIKETVDQMVAHAQDGTDYSGKCYISQSVCYEDARAVADLVEAKFPQLDGKVEINDIGGTIGAHTGPGTVALFFWGDSRAKEGGIIRNVVSNASERINGNGGNGKED